MRLLYWQLYFTWLRYKVTITSKYVKITKCLENKISHKVYLFRLLNLNITAQACTLNVIYLNDVLEWKKKTFENVNGFTRISLSHFFLPPSLSPELFVRSPGAAAGNRTTPADRPEQTPQRLTYADGATEAAANLTSRARGQVRASRQKSDQRIMLTSQLN